VQSRLVGLCTKKSDLEGTLGSSEIFEPKVEMAIFQATCAQLLAAMLPRSCGSGEIVEKLS
jgi:hypothetical protein